MAGRFLRQSTLIPYLACISIFPTAYLHYIYDVWVGLPSASVNETSVTGYSCMTRYILSHHFARYGGPIRVQLALREAESTNSSWQYKTVLTYSCDFGCYDLWYSNFSNYLIGSVTFTNLKPNTLYTVVTFPCYWQADHSCIVDYVLYQSPKVNTSTTPLGKDTDMHTVYNMCVLHVYNTFMKDFSESILHVHTVPVFSVTVGPTSLALHFKPNYYSAGSPPHGHEVVVWAVNEGTGPGPFSHYFKLSVLEAVVKNLQPGTNYTLYVRANGTHFATNQGRWTAQSLRSLPVGGCMHSVYTHTIYMG